MDLRGALKLSEMNESDLADLAGALMNEENAVDWDDAQEQMVDALGQDNVKLLACLSLGYVRAVDRPRRVILEAIVGSSTTDEVEVNAIASRVGEPDDFCWHVDEIIVHDIVVPGSLLTDAGYERAIEIAKKKADEQADDDRTSDRILTAEYRAAR